MKQKKIFCFFVPLVLLFSHCKYTNPHKEHFSVSDFRTQVELNGKLYPLKGLDKPGFIKVIPKFNVIIVLELGRSEHIVSVYSLNSLQIIKQFAKHGSGLEDYVEASNLRYLVDSKMLSITDPVKQIVNFYSLDSIIKVNAEVNIIYSIDFDKIFNKTKNHLRRPLILNDQLVDVRNNITDSSIGIFNFYNLRGLFLSKGGKFPHLNENIPSKELTNIFIGGINISDDYKYLIWNYYNLDMIDLYDKNGNLLFRAYGPDCNEPGYKERRVNNSRVYLPTKLSHFGYSGLAKMKDTAVFALYSGLLKTTGEYHCNKLLKFNDKLKPEVLYELDIPVFDFDISWETRKIYALTHKPNAGIVVYNF